MNNKDKQQLRHWICSNASYNDVINASRFGLVENERFTERAREVFIFLWTWSAHRFEGAAGKLQNDIYYYHGMQGIDRRIARIQRIIQHIKEGSF
jgi:hypothetical protein